MTSIRTIGTVILLAALATRAAADEAVLRVPTIESNAGPRIFTLPEFAYAGEAPPLASDDDAIDLAGPLVDLLRDDVARTGGDVVADSGRLIVTGPAEAVAVARSRLAELLGFIRGRSVITVVLSREGAGKIWSGRFDLTRGRMIVQGQTEVRRLVGRLAAEIAMNAAIVSPIVETLTTGTRVGVACHPLSGERALITLSAHVSRAPAEMRSVRTFSGTVDLPEVPFVSVFTTFVAKVGTPVRIVVPAPAFGGPVTMEVTVSALPAEAPPGLVDLAPFTGFADAALYRTPAGTLDSSWLSDHDDIEPDWSRGIERPQSVLERDGVEVAAIIGTLFELGGDATSVAECRRELLGFLREAVLTRLAGELAWDAIDPLDVAAGAESQSERPGDRVSLPLTGAAPALVMTGTLRRFLASVETEVAGGMAIVHPVTGSLFEGESIVAQLHQDGTIGVERTICRLLGRETREVPVHRDIEGLRTADGDQFLDHLRTEDGRSQLRIADEVTEVRREGGVAVVSRWSRR